MSFVVQLCYFLRVLCVLSGELFSVFSVPSVVKCLSLERSEIPRPGFVSFVLFVVNS